SKHATRSAPASIAGPTRAAGARRAAASAADPVRQHQHHGHGHDEASPGDGAAAVALLLLGGSFARLGTAIPLPLLALLAPAHQHAADDDDEGDRDGHTDRGEDQGLHGHLRGRGSSGLCTGSHGPASGTWAFLYWPDRHRPQEAPQVSAATRPFDVDSIRADFPILQRMLDPETPMIYLDGGATSQRPQQVIDAEVAYLTHDHAAVKRGAHRMAGAATDAYEDSRERLAAFLGAPSAQEVVLTT